MNFVSQFDKGDIVFCHKFARAYGNKYYYSSLFYPREIRKAIWVIYAFVHISNQLVADPKIDRPVAQFGDWARQWVDTYNGGQTHSPVLRSAAALWQRYQIPFSLSEDLLAGVSENLEQKHYQTFADLDEYLRLSGATVAEVIAYISGYRGSAETLRGVRTLGKAAALTTILQRLSKDIKERGIIYLAKDDLDRFGVSESDLRDFRFSDNTRALIKYYTEIAHTWYEEALPHINNFTYPARFPSRLIAEFCEDVLLEIKKHNYNILQSKEVKIPALYQWRRSFELWNYHKKMDRL